jgi:hypothetical protein
VPRKQRLQWLATYEMKRDHDLIYGIVKGSPDFLLFIPRKEATDLADIWEALITAKTWGGFRAKMPPEDYEEYMVDSFDDCERPRPDDDTPFERVDEGWLGTDVVEWPIDPMNWMDTYVPAAVMALEVHGGDGDRRKIYATHEVEALTILRREGYEVERDDDLVMSSCGAYWAGG